jgi:hypothetical protein
MIEVLLSPGACLPAGIKGRIKHVQILLDNMIGFSLP